MPEEILPTTNQENQNLASQGPTLQAETTNQENQNLASQGPTLQAENQTVVNQKPAGKPPVLKFIFLGIMFVIGLALIAGAYSLGTQKSNEKSAAISPTPTSGQESTADWKIFEGDGFSFKYPDNFNPENCPEGFENTICSKKIAGTENETEPLLYFIFYSNEQPAESVDGIGKINYKTENINDIETLRTFDLPSRSGAESVFFKNNDGKYVQIGFNPYDSADTFPEQEKYYEIFNQILSTFKFNDVQSQVISLNPTKSNTIITANGATLEKIQYTLPTGWTGRIENKTLLINPLTGGGYLSIKVYDYDGAAGRRDFYCKTTGYCIESSTFTPTKIGNISGYRAGALDNSGGGAEYFGDKGNKFYIISTYNPPSPNDFEKNFQIVLNSLIF